MHKTVEELGEALGCTPEYIEAAGRPGFVLLPPDRTEPSPWVWYAPTFVDSFPRTENLWMLERLFSRGMAAAGVDVGESYGSPAGRAVFGAFYQEMTGRHGLAEKAVLLPQSRGGLMHYAWAAENPEKVLCIAGIFPVGDLRSYPGLDRAAPAYNMSPAELEQALAEHNPVSRLAPLAAAGVPIAHVHGDSDTVVPVERNSGALAREYADLGGSFELIPVPGGGHEVTPAFFQCERLVAFILGQVEAAF